MIPAGRVMIRSFLPSGHAVYCMLSYACFGLFCFAFLTISHVIMPGSSEDGSDRDVETRGAAFELPDGSSRSMIKRVLLYRDLLCTWTIGE